MLSSEPVPQIGSATAKAMAIRHYVEATAAFEKASKQFEIACSEVRAVIPSEERFLVWVSGINYLVTVDGQGNFQVEPVTQL